MCGPNRKRKGVTIAEVFIVLIILAMVTSLSMPRISQARNEAKLSDLIGSLQRVRSAIALYKIDHSGLLPGQATNCGDINEVDFVNALASVNESGESYLDAMDANPFNGLTSICTGSVDLGSATGAGWFLNTATGHFMADDLEFHRAY
jgi:type II secretory pathway pseudopilin PulG